MNQILLFTIEKNREQKTLHFEFAPDTDIWPQFSEALNDIFPNTKKTSPGSLVFSDTDAGIELRCRKALTINGVSVTRRRLKPGDRIILGAFRIIFNSRLERAVEETAAEPEKASRRKPMRQLRTAAVAAALCTAAIIAGCLSQPNRSAQTEIAESPPEGPAAEMQADVTQAEKNTSPASPDTETAGTEAEAASAAPPEDASGPRQLIIVQPGGLVPQVDLDILFIHAHPDDESLDFGCLMAYADAMDLKTGLVTFTDGEAGLDQHPFRSSTGIYPDYKMEGGELAAVRQTELAAAVETLGVDLLIRLGRKNHPYNSIKDELSPTEILEIWGGADSLKKTLSDIIAITKPETIAAPEGPGAAREHFEHEAVGYLTAAVMAEYAADDYKAPKRYITCIDPRQNYLYPDSVQLDSGITVPSKKSSGDPVTLREIQLRALLKHKTQNDAVNVGTGFLPKYPSEYYKIQYWRSNRSWEELFGSRI